MELRYQWMLFVGLIVVLVLAVMRVPRKKQLAEKKKIAGRDLINQDPYYKKQVRIYKLGTAFTKAICLVCVFSCFALLCRPTLIDKVDVTKSRRDIFLCMDISTSVDALNAELVDELKDVVNELHGDRFGIAIFNTTPVVLVPLTDDYDYVLESLDVIKDALEARNSSQMFNSRTRFLDEYISNGTLVNNQDRGSSLIGDGLASTVFYFDKMEEERTRIIIFSTDNDLQGVPTVTMAEAGEICRDHDVLVYGIGTVLMDMQDHVEMKKAIETTGGTYYRQSDDFSVADIVADIQKQQKTENKEEYQIVKTDQPKLPFIFIMLSFTIYAGFMRWLKVDET